MLWKSINNNYEISNYGEVRNKNTGKILKYKNNKNHHSIVLIRKDDNTREWIRIQHLMDAHFTIYDIINN
jgi:hypothetical protein